MAINEESRLRLHRSLAAVLGDEEALTLMEHLPPVGWADVATKRDLDHVATSVEAQISVTRAELRMEIARAGYDVRASLRTMLLGLVGLQMTGAGLAVAITRLG